MCGPQQLITEIALLFNVLKRAKVNNCVIHMPISAKRTKNNDPILKLTERLEILTAETMKNADLWHVTPCG
jgi:hypothetical protein